MLFRNKTELVRQSQRGKGMVLRGRWNPIYITGVFIGIDCAKPRSFRRVQVTVRIMCVKETMMVVAAAFVVVHVQKRCLEKGKHQGQVHQDSSGKPHTHIV